MHEGEDTVAYLELRDYPLIPTPGVSKRTVNVHELIENYDGPSLFIDFDADGKAIGIEVLYPSQD
jgi:uncharacterized protein YuzE